jgi:TolB-like protein/Flp pilus assembly protein TadD
MSSFVSELRRRNVIRAAAFYAASAWLVVQVATQVFPFFDVPAWTVRWIIIAAALGFPALVAFAWFYEITPQGLKRESEVAPAESTTRRTGRRLDRGIIAVMAVAIALLLANQFVHRDSQRAPTASGAPSANDATGAAPAAPAKSIAVLPFTDLSPSHDQEYFSDGMAEELLNALAKLDDLKVAGRTSSFSFKGRNDDLRTIGKSLGVANILEGSLRKQGDKVRITAQLIQVSDGFHLWSETYDGDLSDVFALQERIAHAIADKLEVVLKGGATQRIVTVATTNPEAYELYLQATGIFNRRDGAHFPEAIAALEKAIELDPKAARLHARLSAILSIAQTYTPGLDAAKAVTRAEEHARAASELDPTLAEPFGALGQSLNLRRRYAESRAAFEHAKALDPDDTTSALWRATELTMTGYRKEGDAVFDRLLELDAKLPIALLWRGTSYAYAGDMIDAERLLRGAAESKLVFAGLGLAFVSAAHGDTAAAIKEMASAFKALDTSLPSEAPDVLAAGIYGDAAARARALDLVHGYLDSHPAVVPGVAIYALIRMGEPARALDAVQSAPTSNDAVFLSLLWSPYGRDARILPEFPAFARRIGFSDVWDKYGPPDDCRREASGDYLCH